MINDKQSVVILEPTMNLRWLRDKHYHSLDGQDRPIYNEVLQQMWINKITGDTEWKSINVSIKTY
jgi:hypothetical protein